MESEDPEDQTPTDTSNAERDVVGRDLTAAELDQEHGLTFLPQVEESDIEVIAGDNVVEEDPNLDDPNVERTTYHILTQENGNWVIFWTYNNEVTSN